MALGKSVRFYCEFCGADLTHKAEELFQQELDGVNLSLSDLHNLAMRNLMGENIERILESQHTVNQKLCIEAISRQLLCIAFGALVCGSCDTPVKES